MCRFSFIIIIFATNLYYNMKRLFFTLAALIVMGATSYAQTDQTSLDVRMADGSVRPFQLTSAPRATFTNGEMKIAAGDDVTSLPLNDIDSISYSNFGSNVCLLKDEYNNVNVHFDKIYFNKTTFSGKPAFLIEAEDLDMMTESKSADLEVVDVLPDYADRVSGKLLHITSISKSVNPSITFGNYHLTGKYNIYLVTVPGTYVNPEDSIVRTQKIRFACTHYIYNGSSYYNKTVSFANNPDVSGEKLMIDYSDIDTLLVGRSYESPNIAGIDATHTGTMKFQSQKLSSDQTVNDFYLDCIVLVPVDDEGNELTACDMLVMEQSGVTAYVPTAKLDYVEWQKERFAVEEEIDIPYQKTAKLEYSLVPDYVNYAQVIVESENPNIISIDKKGMMTAETPGSTYVTLTDAVGGASARVKVNVTGTTAGADDLLVNEVMSGNIDEFVDPSFNYGGWIELYNKTDEDLIIAGCYVSDDANDLKKFHLSGKAGIVPAKGFRNLWFDHSDYTPDMIPFKLDYDGGTIYISDIDGNLITSQDYPASVARCSYARKTDCGDEWGWTGYPTPEASNAESVFASEQLDDPEVSMQSCIYNGNVEFQVIVPDGAKLYYTTNGSVPYESTGKLSEDGSFSFTSNVAIRFRAYKDGYLPSNVVTRTFINADTYDNMGVDIRDIPIISIVTANANLNSNELGIFVQGTNGRPGNGHSTKYNQNMDWDRPVDFQYLKNGEYVFSQEVDIATCGGWSRTFGTHSSFKIKADKKYYGLKTLDYPFFDNKPYLKNKTLQIRNGGNDYSCRFKDAALQSLISSTDFNLDCQSYQPTLHFINGKSYGVINMREPNNKHFVYSNYGWDSDEIDLFEMSPDSAYVQKCGDREAWLEWYELSKMAADPVTYNEICKRVDIDEYINYLAVQLYLTNTDWPQNNLKAYRHRDGGKFRFVVFDLDYTLQSSSPFNSIFSKKTHRFDTIYPENTRMTAEIEFVTIFDNMIKNDEFRKKFIDTYCMIGGSIFNPNHVNEVVYDLLDNVAEIQYAIEGYSKSPYNTAYNIMDAFEDGWNSNNRMISYLFNASQMKIQDEEIHYLELSEMNDGDWEHSPSVTYNGMRIPTSYFSGYVAGNVTLKAEEVAGMEFMGWYDAQTQDLVSTDPVFELNPDIFDYSMVAIYNHLSADELPEDVPPIRINEVSAANTVYANDYFKREDWVEFYNTTDEEIDMAGMFVTDNPEKPEKYQIKADANENTVIPAHGYKVMWFDKKQGISQLHAPYRLDDDGDVLYLSAADHSWTDSLAYAGHDGNHTVGRYPDGSDSIYVMNTPTIEKRNVHTSYSRIVIDGQPDITGIKRIQKKDGQLGMTYADATLGINSEEAVGATLYVFAMDGKRVISTKTSLVKGTTPVSVRQLAKGTYIAFLKTDNGGHARIKFER